MGSDDDGSATSVPRNSAQSTESLAHVLALVLMSQMKCVFNVNVNVIYSFFSLIYLN